jgi:protein ImuB
MKRIAAIVLPNLACELVLARAEKGGENGGETPSPFGVIVESEEPHPDSLPKGSLPKGSLPKGNAILDAVSPEAWRYGARPGQSVAQANAYVGRLRILHLLQSRLVDALERIAETVLALGTTAALVLHDSEGDQRLLPLLPADGPKALRSKNHAKGGQLYPMGAGAGPFDTVWLDVTGCARIAGGEDLLCQEIAQRVQALGHCVRVAIAPGPRIAQAVARFQPAQHHEERIVAPDQAQSAIGRLPIGALPLERENLCWLGKLGILCVSDLARLDRARLSHRLGPEARDLLELLQGRDEVPLAAYQPPRLIVEEASFDDPLSHAEPLMFVLRGLCARACARLQARGEACGQASLELGLDAATVAFENRHRGDRLGTTQRIELLLPLPLSRAEELVRALTVKVERTELAAPVRSVTLCLDGLSAKKKSQLDLERKRGRDPLLLPTLLAELTAWLGPTRLGVLQEVACHRPEARSRLVPLAEPSVKSRRTQSLEPKLVFSQRSVEPTRLLPRPIEVGVLEPGKTIGVGMNLFVIDRLSLVARIDSVEWWSPEGVSRDYARAWLSLPGALCADAWVYVDRKSGKGVLHGWFE